MDKRTSTNGNKVLGYIAKRIAVRDANTTCASYRSYAPSGQYYYMTTSASVSNLHVTGRYTP